MKLSNVIAFTQHMQGLIAVSDIFVGYYFMADDDAMCLKVTVEYQESYANGGVTMHGYVTEEVSYEEFGKADFDPVRLGEEALSKIMFKIKE